MKLSVLHRTLFHYASSVTDSVNTLHLEPRKFPFQKPLSTIIRVLPATRLLRFTDLFENITHHFEISAPHDCLEVESRIKVDTLPPHLPEESLVAPVSALNDPATREVTWLFKQESRYVSSRPEIWRMAVDLTHGIEAIHAQVLSVMNWVHREFAYVPGSTQVSTHIEEAFKLRSGVCQDFTHVMLGLCRSVGIPARYVSGYLYNGPKDGLLGAQASHAWCEIYLPQAGWIGYDPTNNQVADERYVKAAVGRDYDDVAPLRGSYRGTAHCLMEVEVLVERSDGGIG
jgi:transglutaminase-like putative cysteine protease